jgi:energy-coupling factor transport system substrate-specific component
MTWELGSAAILTIALAGAAWWYERGRPPSRTVALVATLAALAALGRIAFAPIPNVKPTTDIVLIAGYALGGAPGVMVGALAALASNVVLGQGPWTPWQMAAWGLVGLAGAGLGRLSGRRLGRLGLAAACGAAGLLFGTIMNLYTWISFSGDHTLAKLETIFVTSAWFDAAHVIGNVAFCLLFGPALARMLARFRARSEVRFLDGRWEDPLPHVGQREDPPLGPAGTAAACALAALLAAGALTGPGRADAARTPAAYVQAAQHADGGFGSSPQASSSDLHTGWAALGLAATGRNPLDVRKGGKSPIDFIAARSGQLKDTGDLERAILVLAAAGRNARSFAGRDLVAELLRHRRSDGSFDGYVNWTAFGVYALRAAGRPAGDAKVRGSAGWLVRQQNADGGFNFGGKGGPSGIDDTAAVVQALVAAGRRTKPSTTRAVSFLIRRQNADGGFPLLPGGRSNAQSTAFAVQALVAARRDPAKVRNGGKGPIAYLRSLVNPDGSVRYSRTSTQTPVWVTAQALLALERKPFPLARVPRARRARASVAAPPPAGAPASAPARRPAASRSAARRRARAAAAGPAGTPAALLLRARLAGQAVGLVFAPVV